MEADEIFQAARAAAAARYAEALAKKAIGLFNVGYDDGRHDATRGNQRRNNRGNPHYKAGYSAAWSAYQTGDWT